MGMKNNGIGGGAACSYHVLGNHDFDALVEVYPSGGISVTGYRKAASMSAL